ncbi:unnamed protein product [Prorocentrum cordatum]|uniref:Uncharacterized protein n=1 Tax=Prorocentrum cordatum TaxID=2364126 RepID=A0ABN9QIP5_9DINO|nr:unnamed protein product [Polarella glacialis]
MLYICILQSCIELVLTYDTNIGDIDTFNIGPLIIHCARSLLTVFIVILVCLRESPCCASPFLRGALLAVSERPLRSIVEVFQAFRVNACDSVLMETLINSCML